MMDKTCVKCGETKPVSDFYRNRCQCKVCCRLYKKKYNENNKEKVSAHKKKYNGNNKEKIAENCKQYRENNKEKIAEYLKQYRENNKEKIMLSNGHIKSILKLNFKIKYTNITPEMIELKREQLLIHRALKQAKKEGTKWGQQNT